MKKHLKQFLCLFLALGMLACLVACGDADDASSTENKPDDPAGDTSSETSEDSEAKYIDPETKMYVPTVGVLDEYKGRIFTILVNGTAYGTYQSDDFTTEAGSGGIDYGDTYYEQVKARNEWIEQEYGIKLNVIKHDSPLSEIRTDTNSGTEQYDAAVTDYGFAATLAREDSLLNLRTLKNFDENAPWWDASATEAYSVGEKLYFTTGDITIMNKADTWCMLFNKEMIEEYKLEDPYQLFDNNEWTFDKMCEMARAVNNATPTSSWQDASTIYGMVTHDGDILNFYGASGKVLANKDNDDYPQLSFGDEESINLTEKVLSTLSTAEWALWARQAGMQNAFKVFYEGRALFRPSGFTAVTKCRTLATIEFGILPMPRLSDTQDKYYTNAVGRFVACIPKNCKDPEFSGYMLDAFAAGAKNYVTPAYIEVNLIGKTLIYDDESKQVLEYIFSNLQYDVGRVYDFGEITTMFSGLSVAGSSDVASRFDSIKDTVMFDIDAVIADYEENET